MLPLSLPLLAYVDTFTSNFRLQTIALGLHSMTLDYNIVHYLRIRQFFYG